MRRISWTTRWLAGLGVVFVGALTFVFAGRTPSGHGATATPVVTTAPATTPPDTGATGATVATTPPPTAAPVTFPPVRHTHSSGS
jgi:hypothetical protein